MDEQLADLQRRYAFQENDLRRLDEALRAQDKRIEELSRRLAQLVEHVRSLGPAEPEGEEPPPPHY